MFKTKRRQTSAVAFLIVDSLCVCAGFLWVQEVLWHMFNLDTLKTPIKDKEPLCIRVPFLEHEFRNVEPMSLLRDMPAPRIMKTHLSYNFLEKQFGNLKDKVSERRLTLSSSVSALHHSIWVSQSGISFIVTS